MASLLEVTLRGTIHGQVSINRFNYLSGGTPAAVTESFALVQSMGFIPVAGVYASLSIMGWLWSNLTNDFVFDEVQAKVLWSDTDFYTTPFAAGTTGQAGDQSSPPFVAYGFRTNRVRLNVRRGTRRFAGVNEAVVGEGGALTAPMVALVNDLADRMTDVLTYDDEGSTLTFTPVVCGKQEYTAPSGKKAYRYFPNFATQMEHTAVGVTWEAYDQVRSQVSRQYGHGS